MTYFSARPRQKARIPRKQGFDSEDEDELTYDFRPCKCIPPCNCAKRPARERVVSRKERRGEAVKRVVDGMKRGIADEQWTDVAAGAHRWCG